MKQPPAKHLPIRGPARGDWTRITTNLLLLVLFTSVGGFALYQLRSTRALLGTHPAVIEELEASLEDQKTLARLVPAEAEEQRRAFEQRQQLLNRLRILELSRDRMSRVIEGFVVVLLVGVAAAAAGVRTYERHRRARRLARIESALERLSAGSTSVIVDDRGGGPIGEVASLIEQVSTTVGVERQRLAELEQLSAWREGARRLGHEMRTPLTAIQLELQRLRGSLGSTEFTQTSAQPDLRASLSRLESDFRSLQDFLTRFTASAKLPRPNPAPLDLDHFVREFIAAFESAWPGVDLLLDETTRSREATRAWVLGDKELLRQVLVNLVSNAHEAMLRSPSSNEFPADQLGSVHFRVRKQDNFTCLELEDDGPGVPEAIRDQLFQPHVSGSHLPRPHATDRSRLGLGLAISRMIVLEQGGFLSLVSGNEPAGTDIKARGATFRIELPTSDNPAMNQS